ncbi:MAG: hypothetical protein WC827_03115 [Candidatus Paceibacterota bacterium]|jgi:hypothetical protein
MDKKGIFTPNRSLIHPSIRHIVHHFIGAHPVNFGHRPVSIKGRISHLEDVQVHGPHMSYVTVLRTKQPQTDTHMVRTIRHLGQVPATVEVVEAISQLGFENLSVIFLEKPELWDGSIDEINLVTLGSIRTEGSSDNGILFRVRSTGIFVDTFRARNRDHKLPVDWIYPAFLTELKVS